MSYGRICRIFASPPRPLPPVGECSCPPPAPGKLRGLNALSGLPHGITSHIRDLDLVSDPEYQAGQESSAPWSGAHTISRCPCGFQDAVREPCGTQNSMREPPQGMQDHARDPGSNAARGIPCGPTYICNECHLVGTEEQELWGRPGTPGRIAVSIMPVPEASQKTTTCDAPCACHPCAGAMRISIGGSDDHASPILCAWDWLPHGTPQPARNHVPGGTGPATTTHVGSSGRSDHAGPRLSGPASEQHDCLVGFAPADDLNGALT